MPGWRPRRTVVIDALAIRSGGIVNRQALPTSGGRPARIVIAGAGVAGLEAMLALRELARKRVSIDLVAPEREFVYRPMSVLEPFDHETARFDLSLIAGEHDATHCVDTVDEVDPVRHTLRTRAGADIGYDALIVAIGTRAREAIPGALTFGAGVSGASFAVLVNELERGLVRRVAFVLPVGVAWSLPLYELAFNIASHLRTRNVSDFELTIVTPEDAPLILFGNEASDAIRERLEEAGVRLITGTHPVAVEQGALKTLPHGYVHADRVIALPRLEGLPPRGLPHDDAGFIPTNEYAEVEGISDVYAAGDATTFPVKQGGMAAAQADAAADVIVARCGVGFTPRPFRPVLRGRLLAGDGEIYLSADISRGSAFDATVSTEPLWWPPPKISARYLGPYLEGHGERLRSDSTPRRGKVGPTRPVTRVDR
jgi:sulfide:quinone oxidoreductase